MNRARANEGVICPHLRISENDGGGMAEDSSLTASNVMSRKRRHDAMTDDSLAGKHIFVTGGAQGLGLAVACMVARRGAARVAIADRNEDRKAEVESQIAALGAQCLYIVCDAAHPDQIKEAVALVDGHFGGIDGLVNCVGDTRRGTLESTTVELWDAQLAVNLRAPFLFTQAVSAIMRRGRGGSIVNIASVQSRGGLTFCMAYAAAKAGLVCLTRNNAAELAKDGIRVNAINMGWCLTDNEHSLQVAGD